MIDKIAEAKKLHAFLHDQGILKSGRLAKHEYDSDDSNLGCSVKKALGGKYGNEQVLFIMKVLQGVRGEIRGFKGDMEIDLMDIYELKNAPKDIPSEIEFFTTWHLDHFLTIPNKEKEWWEWNALADAFIGLGQVIAGVSLLHLTVVAEAQFHDSLIAAVINDNIFYATVASLIGTFSWKDWSIHRDICVALTIATRGMGALASID